ncbi:MAG TPA: hypothetical protein VF776_05990 [Sphingomicrobium sp.]
MAAKPEWQEQVTLAAELIREAMQLLDEADAPSDIAAHLDLAVTRIDELAVTRIDGLADPRSFDQESSLSPDEAQAG